MPKSSRHNPLSKIWTNDQIPDLPLLGRELFRTSWVKKRKTKFKKKREREKINKNLSSYMNRAIEPDIYKDI